MDPRIGRPSVIPHPEHEIVYKRINDLVNPRLRKNALFELSKRRETIPDLGPMLYHSFGTLSVLLQEIITVYPLINPPSLSIGQSKRACNALELLQCVASHHETRNAFLAANIHKFIYPLLEIIPRSRALRNLKLASLGVIQALKMEAPNEFYDEDKGSRYTK